LITDRDEMAYKLRRLKDFGRSGGGNDIHDSVGYNFKFTELQACVGIEQMKKLPQRVQRKKEIWCRYRDELQGVPGVRLFEHDVIRTSPWFIDSLVDNRDGLISHLKAEGIGTRVMYPPINRQKAYDEVGDHVVSEHVGRHGLWLPSAVQLTDHDVNRVCYAIRSFCAP
jgi:perosamine synthetase